MTGPLEHAVFFFLGVVLSAGVVKSFCVCYRRGGEGRGGLPEEILLFTLPSLSTLYRGPSASSSVTGTYSAEKQEEGEGGDWLGVKVL